ncbi:hypothetical protein IPZ68_02770 [Streptomyces arenae]|nr:hypothetical protein [Streptomyces arenae]
MVPLSERPGLRDAVDRLVADNMPPFMAWESPGNWRWHHLYERFAAHQLCVVDADGALLAAANGLPVRWNGTVADLPGGSDDVLVRAVDDDLAARPTALCLLSVSVAREQRGAGLPRLLLGRARRAAADAGWSGVIIPVRPTDKARYPLVPLAEYARWRTPDGAPFDPWLRTHLRLGAEQLAIAEESLTVRQPVKRWEQVLGSPMPGPGPYVVPGALAPVRADADGTATYVEPNVWVVHRT